jgi:hypothetical protein
VGHRRPKYRRAGRRLAAAELALSRSANAEADRYVEAGLTLIPRLTDQAERQSLELGLQLARANAFTPAERSNGAGNGRGFERCKEADRRQRGDRFAAVLRVGRPLLGPLCCGASEAFARLGRTNSKNRRPPGRHDLPVDRLPPPRRCTTLDGTEP